MLRSISIFFILLAISTCASFPVERKVSSFAIPQDTATLARVLREMGASDCGDECSGFSVLNRGEKALRWRLVLADSARKSIDVQYYIWQR